MSQAKVDQYKQEKANRKKTIAKQKAGRMVAKICGIVVVVAIVALIGVKGYSTWESRRPANTYYVNLDPVQDYLDGLDTEE